MGFVFLLCETRYIQLAIQECFTRNLYVDTGIWKTSGLDKNKR